MAKKQQKSAKKSTRRRTDKATTGMPRQEWFAVLGVLFITFLMFLRTKGYDFVNWDDDFNIAKNPNLRYFDWANIKGIFTSHVIGNYNPLTIFTFALEKHFFGLDDPGVFHLTNVLLHTVCTYLVYRLSRLLGLTMWPAAAVALMFGIHPMRIESVAWVTERKDVLFAVFYLGALIQYVRWYTSGKKMKHVIWILLLFTLSLFSKIQAVALPLSMLAVDYLLARKVTWKLLIEKVPYFLLSLLFGLLGVYFLSQQGSLDSTDQYHLGQRLIVGMYSYAVYLAKFLVPFRISPLYPYPATLPWFFYVSPLVILGVLFLFWKAWNAKWRPVVFGLAFFTFNIAFVLQVVGAGQGFLADRFTYVPYFGLMFMLAYYAHALYTENTSGSRFVVPAAVLWFTGLAVVSWIHVPVWKDSANLWTHVMKYYQNTPLPFRNRAQYYRDNKQFDLAIKDYNRSIALKKDADVVNSRARLYFDQQKWPEAIADYNDAIALKPTGEFYINRGAAHAMMGNLQAALSDMTEGIKLDPDFPNGYKNRSLVYQAMNKPVEAQADLQAYLKLDPYDGDIWYESGRLYRMVKDERKALECFNKALQLGQKAPYYLERAKANLNLGNTAMARQDLQRAEQLGATIDAQTRASFNSVQ